MIEHLLDPCGLLRKCYTLLKPGGWLVVAAPLRDGLQAAWLKSRWLAATESPRHVSIPSREGLRKACQTAGFQEISIVPDSLLNCAGILALSLLPRSTTPGAYGSSRRGAVLVRLLAGLAIPLAIPYCWIENHVCRRPASGVVFARKPPADRSCNRFPVRKTGKPARIARSCHERALAPVTGPNPRPVRALAVGHSADL